MSDPQNPVDPNPYSGPTAPSAYGTPAYASAPPAPYGPPVDAPIPGKGLGVAAFILAFFVQLVALILGIVALVQSKKAGHSNGFAVAAIIISSVLIVIGVIVAILIISYSVNLASTIVEACSPGGSGTVVIWGQPVACSQIDSAP